MGSRPQNTYWKVLRTDLTALTDPDWADDVSDALPETTVTIPTTAANGKDGTIAVEWVLHAYVAATGLLVDYAGETYEAEITDLVKPPRGSNIVGRTFAGEQIAVATVNLTNNLFGRRYRRRHNGADATTIRLHTLSLAPVGADRYELWYRELTDTFGF